MNDCLLYLNSLLVAVRKVKTSPYQLKHEGWRLTGGYELRVKCCFWCLRLSGVLEAESVDIWSPKEVDHYLMEEART
jgi:hypothetical protein